MDKHARQQKDDFNKRLAERIKSHREDEKKMEQLLDKRRESKKVEAIKSDNKMPKVYTSVDIGI